MTVRKDRGLGEHRFSWKDARTEKRGTNPGVSTFNAKHEARLRGCPGNRINVDVIANIQDDRFLAVLIVKGASGNRQEPARS